MHHSAVEQHYGHVLAERVLDRDGEGLDVREGAIAEQRNERCTSRVGAEDLGRGGAEDPVLVVVDEGAVEEEGLVRTDDPATGGVHLVDVAQLHKNDVSKCV